MDRKLRTKTLHGSNINLYQLGYKASCCNIFHGQGQEDLKTCIKNCYLRVLLPTSSKRVYYMCVFKGFQAPDVSWVGGQGLYYDKVLLKYSLMFKG